MNHSIARACPGRLAVVLLALAAATAPAIAQAGWKTRLHPAAASVPEAQAATLFQLIADPFDPLHNDTKVEAVGLPSGEWTAVGKMRQVKGGRDGIRLLPGPYLLRVTCESEDHLRQFEAEPIEVVAGEDYYVECRGHSPAEMRVRISHQPRPPAGTPLPVRTGLVEMPAGHDAARIGQAVKAALANRGWQVTGEAPGRIDAHLQVREHAATIRIDYDPAEVSFAYVDSANLDLLVEDGATYLHRNYYNWIRYLGADIGLDLAGQPLTR